MTTLYFEPLPKDRIVQAFPLMRELHPRLSLDEWTHAAADLVGKSKTRGVVTAMRNGYMRGLFSYRLTPGDSGEMVLVIEDLVAMDVLAGSTLAQRFAEEIGALAGRLGAARVRIDSRCNESLAHAFESAGFEVRNGVHC